MQNEQENTAIHPDLLHWLMDSVLTLYLQPLYSIQQNQVYGAEVLTRLIEPNGNVSSPFDFIQGLEKIRMISLLDYEVIRRSCRLLADMATEWPEFQLSCNVSRLTLLGDGFLDCVDAILADTGVDPHRLIFEITENSHDMMTDELEPPLDALRSRGITVAIDDLGTEASCLEMLYLPQIGIAKLDRSLICKAEQSDRARTVISALIELCHRLGMTCVAEGIETPGQIACLKKMNCDRLQGYLIGKPMPIDEFFARFAPQTEEQA